LLQLVFSQETATWAARSAHGVSVAGLVKERLFSGSSSECKENEGTCKWKRCIT
jgi:hypothetical protein